MQPIVSSEVVVTNFEHGQFVVDSQNLGAMFERVISDVNYSRRIVAALVTERTETNYFDADEITLFAALVDNGVEPYMVNTYMAQVEDSYITEVYRRYNGEGKHASETIDARPTAYVGKHR